MFSQSMDSARDAGGVAGTVLIPMRFAWPYGGRSVFLSGSFTRLVFFVDYYYMLLSLLPLLVRECFSLVSLIR